MGATPQGRAVKRRRKRLNDRGLARFEVVGRPADRELIRTLAKRLAGDDAESAEIRNQLRSAVVGESTQTGGILKALRRSPLVGADLDLKRPRTTGRRVDL